MKGFGNIYIYLSKAGKGVLIKSVLQSIPTYVTSYFHLPDYLVLLHEIKSIISRFWENWNYLCMSKRDGV